VGGVDRESMDGMDDQWIGVSGTPHMHVKGGDMHVEGDLPAELTEQAMNEMKAGVRAILVGRLEKIWGVVEPFLDEGTGTGVDVRMAELGLRVIRELAIVHEVSKPDRGTGQVGSVETITQSRRVEILAGLASRAAFLEGEA